MNSNILFNFNHFRFVISQDYRLGEVSDGNITGGKEVLLLMSKFASAGRSQNEHSDRALLTHKSVHGTLILELFRSHFVLLFNVQW